MLSYIQVQILTILQYSGKGLRYSELRPQEVSNDLFKYHLNFLQEKGIIRKNENLYHLTTKGKKQILALTSEGNWKAEFQVKVYVYLTQKTTGKTKILLHQKQNHPYKGDITPISGNVELSEKLNQAADRKLFEETGLKSSLKLFGSLRKTRFDSSGKLIQDCFYYVFHGKDPQGKLLQKNKFGKNSWTDFADYKQKLKTNVSFHPIDLEIIERIEREDFDYFFEEISHSISNF